MDEWVAQNSCVGLKGEVLPYITHATTAVPQREHDAKRRNITRVMDAMSDVRTTVGI